MKNIISLIAAVLLTFLAVALLMASIQHSSELIGVKVQNVSILPTDVQVEGSTNSTGGDSADNSGAPEMTQQNSGLDVFKIVNLSSLSFISGGPEDPDNPNQLNYWLIIIALVVLAIVALAGFIIWRRRRKKPAVSPGVQAPAPPAYFEGDYRIRFPQIGEPFKAIWGEGEELDVTIESVNGASGPVTVDVDGNAEDVELTDGKAQFRLELEKGDHRITVGAKAPAPTAKPSWAVVRIVDYREEIVRMFNEMYLNYRSRYEGVGDKMTPREMEQTIGPGMPEAKRKALDVAVTVFELANYSLHGMGRTDYERMYLSEMDVA